MVKYLGDEIAMVKVSKGFSERSNGFLIGIIGVIDGWLIRIVRHGWRDRIMNPVSFFSGKGFYALNVQCIIDNCKPVLWLLYFHKGCSYDSSCLQDTDLHGKLIQVREELYKLGYYILRNSSYAIE